MRSVFITLFLLTFSLCAGAQELILASADPAEPIALYRQASESLSNGNTRKAKTIFHEVIVFYQEEGRLRELSQSYLGMALAFALNGNYPESIRYHKKALRAHHKYRRNEPADDILMNLALAWQLAGKEKKSKRLLARL
jgi:tetratricopeptide (TPR) repeat protein